MKIFFTLFTLFITLIAAVMGEELKVEVVSTPNLAVPSAPHFLSSI